MLVASVADRAIDKTTSLEDACEIVWAHPQVRAELLDLLEVLAARVDHVQQALVRHPDVPLLVHARYTRLEILAAFGIGEHAKVAPVADRRLLGEGRPALICSPSPWTRQLGSSRRRPATATTPISRDLIHWESQSSTRADSETGRRYQQHEALGSSIMLFAPAPQRRQGVLVPRAGELREA